MAAALPTGHPWRARLMALDHLSPAATAYRYPSPRGRLLPPPTETELQTDFGRLGETLAAAEVWCRQTP